MSVFCNGDFRSNSHVKCAYFFTFQVLWETINNMLVWTKIIYKTPSEDHMLPLQHLQEFDWS